MRTSLLIITAMVLPCLAHGTPAVELEIQGDLPFARQELLELVRLRLPVAPAGASRKGHATRAVVRAGTGDRVSIQVGSRRREASLTDLDRLAGARLVALLLLDLVSGDAPRPPSVVARPRVEPVRRGPPRFLFGISPRFSFRVPEDGYAVEPMVELEVRVYRWLWAWLEAGYSWNTHSDMYDHPYDSIPIRTGLALRLSWFELRGGLAIRPYWLGGARSWYSEQPLYDVEDRGVQVGGTIGLRVNVPIGRWLVVHGMAGVDLFPQREVYSVWEYCSDPASCGSYEVPVMSTSHVVPWVGLGIGFQVGG